MNLCVIRTSNSHILNAKFGVYSIWALNRNAAKHIPLDNVWVQVKEIWLVMHWC